MWGCTGGRRRRSEGLAFFTIIIIFCFTCGAEGLPSSYSLNPPPPPLLFLSLSLPQSARRSRNRPGSARPEREQGGRGWRRLRAWEARAQAPAGDLKSARERDALALGSGFLGPAKRETRAARARLEAGNRFLGLSQRFTSTNYLPRVGLIRRGSEGPRDLLEILALLPRNVRFLVTCKWPSIPLCSVAAFVFALYEKNHVRNPTILKLPHCEESNQATWRDQIEEN
ncbi:uncharacterized protein LOC108299748 [Cebus imitator]|uniref:uncharacterized protein LOC108299748 n=1 Tax=Cebus imitator TaxID=2715852 RepID=UPI0018974B80|nr:uncharacterized protein LOC108299748 [Cebus imitator]